MANISSIKLPNNETYDLKDKNALPLTGGQVTGPVTFGDSVSMDDLTAGQLVVEGAASVTNNLQVNTINGIAVGSSPKFTDTVTTVSVTGSGNAITTASASNGTVTLTKGTTFLTSHNTYSITNSGSGNAVTAVSLSGTTFTVTKGTTFLTSHQDISGKADKSATVSNVAYDSTNAKITKTINDITSDVVTVATLKTALGSMPASDVYSWAKASTKPTYTASEVGAATSGHTHTTSIATSTATNQITLAYGAKYALTAGGTSYVFTMPSADDTNTTYSLSGALSSHKFTTTLTPSSGSATTSDFTLAAGTGITITDDTSARKMTIACSVTNTDTKLQVAEVTSATQYYPLVGTGTTTATRQYDTTGFKYKGTTGTTSAVGSAILELGNSTASGTAGNKQGQLIVYGTNAKKATITLAAPSADIALALPTSGGTLALTSQIPTVPTVTGSNTTGITASTSATKTTLGTAFSIPNVTSVGSASTWTFEEKTIPNVTSVGSASTWSFTDVTVPIRADSDTTVPTAASSATACDDITAWSAGSGSFTSGAFSGGSGSFSATVTNHVLSFSHTHTAATHAADSHTHTAPSLSYTARSITGVSGSTTVRGVKTGTSSTTTASKASGANGTAPTLGTAITVQSKSGGANGSAPTLGTAFSVPNVTGNTSATVSITDPGHTHSV